VKLYADRGARDRITPRVECRVQHVIERSACVFPRDLTECLCKLAVTLRVSRVRVYVCSPRTRTCLPSGVRRARVSDGDCKVVRATRSTVIVPIAPHRCISSLRAPSYGHARVELWRVAHWPFKSPGAPPRFDVARV